MTSLFLTFFLGSHLGVRADLFIAVTFGIKSGAQWKNFLGSTRTCVNDIDHPRSLQTPQLGHLYWQPSTLLGPAGDLKWFGMRANLLLPVIKLFSYSPSPAPFSLWVFAVPQKHWETHFAGECLSTLSWCQWHQRGHTTCSVLSWNRALGPVADGDRIAVLARDLQLSHPECHPRRWEESSLTLNVAFAVIFLESFCHNSTQFTLYGCVREKEIIFFFSWRSWREEFLSICPLTCWEKAGFDVSVLFFSLLNAHFDLLTGQQTGRPGRNRCDPWREGGSGLLS